MDLTKLNYELSILKKARDRVVGVDIHGTSTQWSFIIKEAELARTYIEPMAERIAYLESRVMELKEEVRKARQR